MPKLIVPYDRDRSSSVGDWVRRQTGSIISHVTFFLAMTGTLWLMGRWHLFLHGGEREWIHELLMGHPFAVTATMYLAVGTLHMLGFDPDGRARTSPAADTDTPAVLVARARALACAPVPDLAAAHALLVRAREAGSPHAAFALADWYANGIVVERDRPHANALYGEAAAGGIAGAMYAVAVSRENGWDTSPDARAAYQGYLRASLLGHTEACREVARCLADGIGTQADPEAASAWRDAFRARGGTVARWSGGTWPWEGNGGVTA